MYHISQQNGGTLTQNPGPDTFCIVAERINVRVKNIIRLENCTYCLLLYYSFFTEKCCGKGKLPAFKLAFELECAKFGICVVISLPSNGNLDIKTELSSIHFTFGGATLAGLKKSL